MKKRLTYILFLCAMLLSQQAYSQLDANFYASSIGGVPQSSGCAPLILRMNDASVGTGNPTTWYWETDIPSSSTLQNPVFGFVNPGSYTVKLTITSGGVVDTFVQTITVYPNPVIDFEATPTIGCAGFTTCFTDLSSSPGYPITAWTWDFGDGNVSQGVQNPCHTYNTGTNPCFNVTLIAVNDQGCTSTGQKNNYICLTQPPAVNFAANQRVLCSSPFEVSFFDSSVAANGLSYLWNFGDNNTSTQQNPTHTYTTNGNFNVRLTVTDTVCNQTSTIIRNSYIRTSNLVSRPNVSVDTICLGEPIQFSDSSIGTPNAWLWNFGYNNVTSTLRNPVYTYPVPGNYIVSLRVTNALNCIDDSIISFPIVVLPVPTANITANNTNSCQAPFLVNFNSNASVGTISYYWDFGDSLFSSAANPTHNYTTPGNYTVTLIVTNNLGCSDTFSRTNFIRIEPTIVNFTADSLQGCAPLNICFRDSSVSLDPIVSRQWNFGDPASGANNTSTLLNPCHLFQNVGSYTVTLTATTQGGCIASTTRTIGAGSPPTINFNVSTTTVCAGSPVQFTNTSTGNPAPNNFLWEFQGGPDITTPNATNVWDDPGQYTVTFTVGYNGCNIDTTVLITVLDPKPEYNFAVNCNVPGQVVFTNTSVNATSYVWNFGDGSPTSTLTNPSHTYATSGNYTVILLATNSNTGCTAEYTRNVTISNTQANFTSNRVSGCAPLQVNFTSTSTGNGLTYVWNFGVPGATSTAPNPSYTYTAQGQYTVSLRIRDVNGCQVTETKTAYISVSDVTPDFIALLTYGCLPESGSPAPIIQFQDLSTIPTGSFIESWSWNFGNGIQAFSLPGNPPPALVNRAYNIPNLYDVSLSVTTNLGCTRTINKPQYIDINQPIARFTTPYNLYCPNQDVPFVNTSTGEGLTYQWNFGDPGSGTDNSSTLFEPTHAYQDSGYYTVSLVATDVYGCRDTLVRPNYFYVGKPELNFFTEDTFRFCPPFLVNFTNMTNYDTLNISRIEWDFGDNTGALNVENPSHIYNQAGFFEVKVVVSFENGCVDSLAINNYINIGGAVGNMTLSRDPACLGDCILLNANSTGAVSTLWAPGDGPYFEADDTVTYCYNTTIGRFIPVVYLSDDQQPQCTYALSYSDTLTIDSVSTNFTTNVNDTACAFSPVQFTDLSSAYFINPIVRWEWDFGDGGTSTVRNPTYIFTTPGLNTVTLTSYNSIGCYNTHTRNIWIVSKPEADFTISDSIGCDSLFTVYTDASIQGDFPITGWRWNFGDPATAADTSNIQGPHTYSYNILGSYTPRLIVRDAYGCRDTIVKTVNVYPVPSGIANADTINICYGDSVVLEGTAGYATYDWSPGLYLSDSTIAQPTAYAVDTITYVLVTTDFTSCQSFDTVTINVLPLPTLSLTPYPDTNICLGDTVQLVAVGDIIYEWEPPIEISDVNIANPIVFPTNSRYYKVTTTDIYGCKSADSVRVIINRLYPEFEGERSCLGSPADFVSVSAYSDRPITQYSWDFGDGSPIDNQSGRFPIHTFPDSGLYQVTLTIFDIIGCSDSITKTIQVDFPLDAFAGNDTLICLGATAQLYSGGGDSVYWRPTNGMDNPNSFTPNVSPTENTTYTAYVSNGVCPADTASVRVVVNPLPSVNTLENRMINRGVTIELTTTAGFSDSIYWNTTDTTISCLNCLSPTATPFTSTLYVVTAVDNFGCISSDSVFINVNEFCNDDVVFVPTGFTPNGDGANDILYARMFGAKELILFRVFDRWGKLLFETNNPNTGWDGTNRDNEKLITGVYVYVIEAVCFNGEKLIKKGNITLLK